MPVIAVRIKKLREQAGLSQAQLARRLDVTRSSVNAWEMGISTPTTQYVVAMARLFHVTVDYLLSLESSHTLVLNNYSTEELQLVYSLVRYIDQSKRENE